MKKSGNSLFQLRFNVRGMVCFVDDDENYLKAMQSAYKGDRPATTFRIPAEAAKRLVDDNTRLVDMERELACIFAEESLAQRIRRLYAWLMDTRRHDCIEVCFCDYAMPALSGTKLLSKIPRSRVRRVLLTGMADSQEAVLAMNAGHIDAFLPKNDPHLARQIQTYANHGPILQVDGLWRELPSDVRLLIEQPAVSAKLWAYLEALDVDEHIMLPMPLGFLCRTKSGKGLWVQLEVLETQAGAVEILRDQGFSNGDVLPILQGQKTACLEVLPALHASTEELQKWSDIHLINHEPWLGLAVFELPIPVAAECPQA